MRSGWRSGFEGLLVAALVGACGTAGVSAQTVAFTEHGVTQQSGESGGPRISVAIDPAAIGLGALASAQPGRLYIAVFAGSQRTGGYDVRVSRIDRSGDTLTVRATFSSPAAGALVIQVLTSPAQLVSIDKQSAAGVRAAVLVDQTAAERARSAVPQSTP